MSPCVYEVQYLLLLQQEKAGVEVAWRGDSAGCARTDSERGERATQRERERGRTFATVGDCWLGDGEQEYCLTLRCPVVMVVVVLFGNSFIGRFGVRQRCSGLIGSWLVF